MFCPHCHNKIPDGSNICPLCYANLAGVKPQASAAPKDAERQDAPARTPARKSSKKAAYTKGSRGGKKNADMTPMIIAFGLIVILIIIIVMIFRSMFSAGDSQKTPPVQANTPIVEAHNMPNFIVFGATATPGTQIIVTPTPAI